MNSYGFLIDIEIDGVFAYVSHYCIYTPRFASETNVKLVELVKKIV